MTLTTDFKLLHTILKHLIYNAFKFTKQGKIELGCRLIENKAIEFWVQDNGIGISKEDVSFIFDEFRQVDDRIIRNFGGNGIGLNIVKNFCIALCSKIHVESELDKGSKFKFTIPLFD